MDFPNVGPTSPRIFGVVIGLVIDNKDPEGMYRVKVRFPWVKESSDEYTNRKDSEDFLSAWARIASLMAGGGRGAFWLPEIDDEVLVAFEHGDLRRPFILGSLWNGKDKPIHDNDSQQGKNDFRTFYSRSGHVIQFQDGGDAGERIIIQTKVASGDTGKAAQDRDGHFIVLDHTSGAEKIEIYDRQKKNYVLIDSTNNKVEVKSADGDIVLSAPNGKIQLDCKTLETRSSTTTKIKADSTLNIESGSTADVKSSSAMTIKGSVVKIN
jgi:uncharacterized protein involved in type VI secretion and phage assembly